MAARRRLLALIIILVTALASHVGGAEGTVVSAGVEVALEARGRVTVCVSLDAEAVPGDNEAARCRRYARAQERFLPTLPAACRVGHRFTFSPLVMLELTSIDALRSMSSSPMVRRVSLDLRGHGALDESRAVIRADEVREQLDIVGRDAVVAVLDTGINTGHPDLADAVLHEHHFLLQGEDVGPGAEDDHGHGSNVSSIIASRGTVAPRGVAPAAGIVAIKVLEHDNRGWISDWVRGLEYVVALHDSALDGDGGPGEEGVLIDAVNMSLVTDILFTDTCDGDKRAVIRAFGEVCQAAADRGIVLIGASGNDYSSTKMGSPACFSSVIAVGSVRDLLPERISSFTNRNALLDLLAPGQSIKGIGLGEQLREFQGTSQAAPHVAALVCLLRETRPGMTSADMLRVMRETGVAVNDSDSGRSFPRIHALDAVNAVSVPEPVFMRSDCNGDGDVNVSDPVRLLTTLFRGAAEPPCSGACDSNDDGVLDLADAIHALAFMFQSGVQPPAPFRSCGPDPTPEGVACATSTCL